MFITRTISAVILVIIAFGTIWAGDVVLLLTMAAVSIVGFREITKAAGAHPERAKDGLQTGKQVRTQSANQADGVRTGFNLFEIVGFAGIAAYYALLYFQGLTQPAILCIILTLMCMMAVYVLAFPKYRCEQPIVGFFAYFYAPVLLSFIYLTRTLENGFYLVWMIFISSWISDTCAYLTGRALGKHKLAPKLSPKKSIEGSVGGILGSALVGALYALILAQAGIMNVPYQIVSFTGIGAAGSVISQIGDLAASGIKRDHDIKDYGKLIPGHGGIMDRFDSVIVTAPIIYFLSLFWVAG